MVHVHLILTGASGYLGQHLLGHWIQNGGPTVTDASSNSITSSSGSGGDNDMATTAINDGNPMISSLHITALYNRAESFPDAVKLFQDSSTAKSTDVVENGSSDDIDGTSSKRLTPTITMQRLEMTDEKQIDSWLKELSFTSTTETTKEDTVVIVVHTAAMSSPRVCQQDPDKARKINIPKLFFDAIRNKVMVDNIPITMIALSTDQVYDGKQNQNQQQQEHQQKELKPTMYVETEIDALKPLNVYGESKLEMEEYLKSSWTGTAASNEKGDNNNDDDDDDGDSDSNKRRKVIRNQLYVLRSSIILGPKTPIDPQYAHDTFLHFVQSRGISQEPTTFYTNEYRTVISVRKVMSIIDSLIMKSLSTKSSSSTSSALPVVWNMGGSVRANRLDMAKAVFDHFTYDNKPLQGGDQTSPSVPLDISMDSSQLRQYGVGDPAYDEESLADIVRFTFDST